MTFIRLVAVAATVATVVAGAATTAEAQGGVATPATVRAHLATTTAEAAAALDRAHPRPRQVTGLTAYEDGRRVTLSWHNPAAGSFQRVVVRYRVGHHAPAGPRRGVPADVDGSHATTAILHHLTPDTPYAVGVWTVAAGRTSKRVDLSFRTAGPPPGPPAADAVISGIVTDSAGAPLAGVVVSGSGSQYSWSGPRIRRSVTDSHGHYSLTLPRGLRYLAFDGSRATGGSSDATGYLGDTATARLARHQHLSIDRTLQVAAALRGRVVDGNGRGVAGARISPSFPFPFVDVDTFVDWAFFEEFDAAAPRTGPRGYFRMPGLPEDSLTVCARAVKASTQSACSDHPVLTSPGTIGRAGTITVPRATPAGSLVGRVTDADGNPVRGAAVFVNDVRSFSAHFGHTAADGRFRVGGLRRGTYDLCVWPAQVPRPRHRSGLQSSCPQHSVFVRSGRVTRRDVALRAGAAVSGVVRGADGRPVRNADVSVDGPNAESDATTDRYGRFAAVGLPSGRYRVCVEPLGRTAANGGAGYAPACADDRVVLKTGHTLLGTSVELPLGGAIVGQVAPSSTGRPELFAYVHRIGAGFRDFYMSQRVRAGGYRLTGLTAGQYRVCFDVSWSDLAVSTQCLADAVTVRSGRTATAAAFALRPTGAITVAVQDSAGHPIAGVDTTAVMPCASQFECDHLPFFAAADPQLIAGSWMTWNDGKVLLDGLRPGHYAVCAFAYLGAVAGTTPPTGFADACSGSTFDVTLAANQVVHRTLTLTTAGAVTGTVTDTNGNPLQGVFVHVTGSAATDTPHGGLGTPAHKAAVTGPDGTFTVRSVTPGNQVVCFRASRARDNAGPVAVQNQCFGGQPGRPDGTPVTVTSGQVSTGIDVALTPQS